MVEERRGEGIQMRAAKFTLIVLVIIFSLRAAYATLDFTCRTQNCGTLQLTIQPKETLQIKLICRNLDIPYIYKDNIQLNFDNSAMTACQTTAYSGYQNYSLQCQNLDTNSHQIYIGWNCSYKTPKDSLKLPKNLDRYSVPD